MSLFDQTQKRVITVAPDVLVYIDGEPTVQYCNNCEARANFNEYIYDVQVNNEVGAGDDGLMPTPATATVTLRNPIHSPHPFYKNGVCVFSPMQKIQIWMKGYFPREGGVGFIGKLLSRAPSFLTGNIAFRYYPVFFGCVTKIDPSDDPRDRRIVIHAEDNLRWLKLARGTITGLVLPGGDKGYEPIFSNIISEEVLDTANGAPNPIQVIQYLIYRFFIGNVAFKEDAKITFPDMIESYNRNMQVSENLWKWRISFDDVVSKLQIFGRKGASFRVLGEGEAGDAQNVENEWAEAREFFNSARQGQAARNQAFQFPTRLSSYPFGVPTNIPSFKYFFNQDFIENVLTKLNPKRGNGPEFPTEYESTKLHLNKNLLETIHYFQKLVNYEFYQDMDGTLVLKPPFWNLDVSRNRVQVIKAEEVFSENIRVQESSVLTAYGVNGATKDSTDARPQGYVFDVKLLKQYGFKPSFNNTRSDINSPEMCRYQAAFNLERHNRNYVGGSITIIGRSEIQLGYPIYYEPHDAFYYVRKVSHSYNYGGTFKTTLELEAGRRKIIERFARTSQGRGAGTDTNPAEGIPNLFYIFKPNQDEPTPRLSGRAADVGESPRERLTTTFAELLDSASSNNDVGVNPLKRFIQSLAGNTAGWPMDFGYWDLVQAGNDGVPARPSAESDFHASFPTVGINQLSSYGYTRDSDGNPQEVNPGENAWLIPVSDSNGYEVFGFFGYGRGLSLEEDGTVSVPPEFESLEDIIAFIKEQLKQVSVQNLGRFLLATASKGLHGGMGAGVYNVDLNLDQRVATLGDDKYPAGRLSGWIEAAKQGIEIPLSEMLSTKQSSSCSCNLGSSAFVNDI